MKIENEKPSKTYVQVQEETVTVLEDPGIFEGMAKIGDTNNSPIRKKPSDWQHVSVVSEPLSKLSDV